MKAKTCFAGVVILLLVVSGCSSKRTYRVPPRINLQQHEMIGVIEFDSSSKGQLGALATSRFTESAREDQGMVRMIDVGASEQALRSTGESDWNPETFRALGREHGVQTILRGQLTISEIRPDIRIDALFRSGTVSAEVDATLAVELIEAETGASIWTRSARATRSVGHISIFKGGEFVFDADDPKRAYGPLVDTLVAYVTRDFHAGWERR